jgi:hypothetical protein
MKHRMRDRILNVLASFGLATIPCSAAVHASTLEGRAVQITSSGTPGQPSVAVDPREGFVVTWQEQTGDTAALRYAVISKQGLETRRGEIATGANWFVNWADFPSLVVLDNGDWVTHWLVRSAGGAESYDIRLVRSRDRGRTWSAPIVPHLDDTATQHGFVSLVPAGGDRVLVIWLDGRRGATPTDAAGRDEKGHGAAGGHEEHESPMTLRSAVVGRAGRLSEQAEIDASTCSCCQTDAARFEGRTIVAYRDRSPEEIRDISVLSRSPKGEWSAPRNLHPDGWRIEGCPVNGPAVAVNRKQMLIVWTTAATGEMEAKYTIREWDRAGAAMPLAPGSRMRGRLDAAPWKQGYLISWLGSGAETGTTAKFSGLMVTEVDASGKLVAQRNVASLPLGRVSGNPRMATHRDQALLVWAQPPGEGAPASLVAELISSR